MNKDKLDFIINCIWKGYWADENDMEEVKEIITEKEIAEFIVDLKTSKTDYIIKKWDEFLTVKHDYHIDITKSIDSVFGWLITAFPNWLKSQEESNEKRKKE